MKNYFPDDQVKQEMLEIIVDDYIVIKRLVDECKSCTFYNMNNEIRMNGLKWYIEKATGKPINEVLADE